MIMKMRPLFVLLAFGAITVATQPSTRAEDAKVPAKPGEPGTALTDSKDSTKPKEALTSAQAELFKTYKLVHQDKIKYAIVEDPVRDVEFPELIVSSLGQLSFPVSRIRQSPLVSIQAVGKTLEQVKAELVAQLEIDYYHKATVSLELTSKSERFGQVTFVGPIIKGQLKLTPGEQKKLSEAIVEKGYSDFAKLKRVKVTRTEPGSKKPKEIFVDIDAVLHKGMKDKDIILEDGDTIDVPEKGFNIF
jgi:protein involved in polysaccharide export with SLBB domain